MTFSNWWLILDKIELILPISTPLCAINNVFEVTHPREPPRLASIVFVISINLLLISKIKRGFFSIEPFDNEILSLMLLLEICFMGPQDLFLQLTRKVAVSQIGYL